MSGSAWLCLFVLAAGSEDKLAELPDFRTQVLPILKAKCGHCHGPNKQEANVRFDTLTTDLSNRAAAQTWHEALNAINGGDMPPENQPQLEVAERALVTRWMRLSIQQAIADQKSTGGRAVMRRLNRIEYQNTMFDLLGLDMEYTRDLPPDPMSTEGFRNNGQALRMSAIQLEYYLAAARRALDKIIETDAPPKVFRHEFKRSNVGRWRGPTEPSNLLERAQKFLAKIVNDYPEQGDFRIRVKLRSRMRPNKGFPRLEVAVGYRPDTEVHFKVMAVKEVVSEDLQQFEFTGRIENFPLPVRGQGKYPGLVIRLRNVYDDGTPVPNRMSQVEREGKKRNGFPHEPNIPQLLIESVEFEGPIYSQWPTKRYRQILFESKLRDTNETEYARQVLTRFMTRAYRRPPTRNEVEQMFSLFCLLRPEFLRYEDALRETLAMILIQPDFLYLMEPAGDHKRPINAWEMASRLSFFLWSTMPDERLFEQARNDMLLDPGVLKAEVRRMLNDPRSERFVTHFVSQWLHLDRVEYTAIDRQLYPKFRDQLKASMQGETIAFFAELLRKNRPATLMLDSDFAMLNEPLARHYGIPGVYGQTFRPVPLPPKSHRGGLLGQASILLAHSSGRDSHPIRRAVFIRDRLLDDPPAPPPPDVPDLDQADPKFASLSVREQLDVHRSKESCASCHRGLDPWGIALENFDAVGKWRETIRKNGSGRTEFKAVSAEATLPNGQRLQGFRGLKENLLQHQSDKFTRAIVRSLMTYALGRSLELTDEPEIEELTTKFINDQFLLQPLIEQIVLGEAFRTK